MKSVYPLYSVLNTDLFDRKTIFYVPRQVKQPPKALYAVEDLKGNHHVWWNALLRLLRRRVTGLWNL